MPFGLIFGALFFGFVCSLLALRLLLAPALDMKGLGAALLVLGTSIALGLLQRRPWARWLGACVAALMAVYGLRLVSVNGATSDLVLLFVASGTALLLLLPATGDTGRGAAAANAAARGAGPCCWTAIAGLAGVLALGPAVSGPTRTPTEASRTLPASAVGLRGIDWSDFATGIERSRVEGKPVLATFVTDWCPYCSKMARKTWRASSVVERLDDVVAVRVDAEQSAGRPGTTGLELARRYGVSGYPAQLLLDAQGRVLSRHDGYQTASQLLDWLDRELGDSQRRDLPPTL